MLRETILSLPFTGTWVTQNSPARRVPSHGVDVFGERYAIDFVAVDDRGRTANIRDWRTAFSTEPPERFYGFGKPILAPVDGTVVAVHDGEVDHEGRRSQLALLPYALSQGSRLRQGVAGLAGNHLTIALKDGGAFVAIAHLKAGSFTVAVGDEVSAGQPIAECGNSGNSTEPHVHLQVMDSADFAVAQGLPLAFRNFREKPRGTTQFAPRETGIPSEGAVVEAERSGHIPHGL
jgi:murein DD-endopeptidase MepM/ murein hydrolase activator NlpD